MGLEEEFVALKLKITESNETSAKIEIVEQGYEALKKELILNRDKTENFRNEVDKVQEENFLLQKELELTKTKLRESEFKLKLSHSKSEHLEKKVKDLNEEYIAICCRDKMRNFELEVLNENVEKLSREKIKLLRQNKELNDSLRLSEAFKKEIISKQNNCQFLLMKTKENVQKLENQHMIIGQRNKMMDFADKIKVKNELLQKKVKSLKEENNELENKLVYVTAKLDTLEKLIESSRELQPLDQVIIEQHKKRIEHYQKQVAIDSETINKLTTALNDQIATNLLIFSNIEPLETEENPESGENEKK